MRKKLIPVEVARSGMRGHPPLDVGASATTGVRSHTIGRHSRAVWPGPSLHLTRWDQDGGFVRRSPEVKVTLSGVFTQKLDIQGHDHAALPHTFYRQEGGARHLAIVFPGRAYTVQMPVLWYPLRLLLSLGADVLAVDQNYSTSPAFTGATVEEQRAWIVDDALAAYRVSRAQGQYQQTTLVGKSLGTLAMGSLVTAEPPLRDARAVWLTPLLHDNALREHITAWGGRSLFVIGSEDPQYEPRLLTEMERATDGHSLVIEGADHSLEIDGDVVGSIREVERLVVSMEEFLRIPT